MPTELQQLQAGIAAIEAQRALLGDATVEASLAGLRTRLAALSAPDAAETAEAAQQIKQVTILFLDVVGSTTLAVSLDPEEVHAAMDGALSRCARVVEAHRGKVLQYAGDSLLAAFGADEALEDDPEWAVRCGLALLAEGHALGGEIERRYGHPDFNVRVGIHTGGVLLGGGVDAEGTIRGVAVNIAARMEQAAPAGALRISHATYAQVRGVFDVEAQDPMAVKGIAEPITSYLVQRAKPRAFRTATRGIEGVETRMMGRDAELNALQDAFRRLFAERCLAVVTVVAEAGIGKSRLLYEFDNWAEARPERFVVFQGRATAHTQGQPYGLLRDIVAWRLRIADDDTPEVARAKLEQGVVPLFLHDDGADLAEGHAHLLGHLMGLDFHASRHVRGIRDDPGQIRNRAFHAAAQMFRRVCASEGAPIVLQLEDLHWADAASLDFFDYLAQVGRDVPLLVLAFARPSLFERRADWGGADARHRRIDMGALDRSASDLLAGELLKRLAAVPSALRELVIGRAEGNPFYMEELIKMLIDQHAIETGPEVWTLRPERLLGMRVPPTLTGVLQARLDGLPASEKRALQEASVFGMVFREDGLSAIAARAAEALPALVRRELVLPRRDAGLEGVREYSFSHQLLHQVTYDTVLKRRRRELHAQVAAWLAAMSGSRANDGAIAAHYEKAGDSARACEHYTLAAEDVAGRHAHEVALGHVASALAQMAQMEQGQPREPALLTWRLRSVRERALHLLGRRTEQRAEIEALDLLAETLDDDARRADVAWRRCDLAMRSADYALQASAARQAMALAERCGETGLRLRAQARLAHALANLGDPAAGVALASQGLAEARAQGLRQSEGRFLNTLSVIAARHGDLLAGLEADLLDLAIRRELGDRLGEAVALGNIGASRLELGELSPARQQLAEALRLTRAVGDRVSEAFPLAALSQLALWQGDAALALEHAQAALDVATAVQDPYTEAIALRRLGDAELALGHSAAAGAAFERAHSVALAIDDPLRYDAAIGLVRLALSQGDFGAALRRVEALLAELAAGASLAGTDLPGLIRLTCHQVLARANDPRAGALLREAHDELMAAAEKIVAPELRQGFVNNIPHHREIAAAWRARQSAQDAVASSG